MTFLGDYIGQLMSEIALARMQADLETVRLAELYASHPLLRTMPVPHVRLPEVELEIPALIKASEDPRPGETTRGGTTPAAMGRKFDALLKSHLTKSGIVLSAATRANLRAALDERLARSGTPRETAIDVHGLADDLTAAALRTVSAQPPERGVAPPVFPASFASELKESARQEFVNLRTPPPRLSVLVTSAEIREAATPENVTRLRLKVSEHGVEWVTIEQDGVQSNRLVPE